jgi:hypothetical protein
VTHGISTNVHGGSFPFPRKKSAFSIFRVLKSFFCEATTKKASQKLNTQAYKNNISLAMHISPFVLTRKPSKVFLNFLKALADFDESGSSLHCVYYKIRS